jgi:hypothetical protein
VRVPGVCAYPKAIEEVAAPRRGPTLRTHYACLSRRRLIRLIPPIPGLWLCFTHLDCVCNQVVAATNRVCGITPQPTEFGLSLMRKMSCTLFRPMGHTPTWSCDQVVETFKDKRHARYTKALATLKERSFTDADAKVSAFVKSEKFNPADKVNPDPRMIQCRNPRYNILLGQYLRPMERRIYRLLSKRGLRCIAKGLNTFERARLIVEKWACFDEPVCFSLDASRWDKHITADVLRIEHSVYTWMNADPFFARLLSLQLQNRCSTRDGVVYLADARMSGDLNTALGNCLLMCVMIFAVMKLLGIEFEILDDGDDCLLFCEAKYANILRSRLPSLFLEFGQELKLENEAYSLEEIVFCQSRLITTPDGPRMVRNWAKVLSHGTSGVQHWNAPSAVPGMLTAVGHCELALNSGIPIIQAWAITCITNGRGRRLRNGCDVDSGLRIRAAVELGAGPRFDEVVYHSAPKPIAMLTRLSFERAYGVSPAQQVALEDALYKWRIKSFTAIDIPSERASDWEDRSLPELQPPSCL